MTDTAAESPELVGLFNAYTGGADSIGSHLKQSATRQAAHAPLLLSTSTDLALYPGGGASPEVLGVRLCTRGFKELAGVSHLGPALATLATLKEAAPEGQWRADAERLLDHVTGCRPANTAHLWRDVIAVEAYRGREEAIAAMIDYTLQVVGDYLRRGLTEPDYLTLQSLRTDLIEDGALPVSLSRIMIATFFLVDMDLAYRMIGWLDGRELNWPDTMVVIAGQQGRPTAGVTWQTNSLASIILAAARGRLPLGNLYIAPHAPTFETPRNGDLSGVHELEPEIRSLWSGTRATVDLASQMFPGYPAFSPDSAGENTALAGDSVRVSEMPPISGPNDWTALVTRLRLVMEDPRQLLSGAVSDYAAQELVRAGNDPARIEVPGLDVEPYPGLPGHAP